MPADGIAAVCCRCWCHTATYLSATTHGKVLGVWTVRLRGISWAGACLSSLRATSLVGLALFASRWALSAATNSLAIFSSFHVQERSGWFSWKGYIFQLLLFSEAEKGVSHPNPFTSYLDGLCTTSPGRLRPKPVCRVDGLALFYGSGGNWLGLLTLRTPMSYNLTMALASSSPISHMKAPRVAWSKRRDRLVSSSNASSGNHTPGRTLSETRVWEGKGHSTVEQYR